MNQAFKQLVKSGLLDEFHKAFVEAINTDKAVYSTKSKSDSVVASDMKGYDKAVAIVSKVMNNIKIEDQLEKRKEIEYK